MEPSQDEIYEELLTADVRFVGMKIRDLRQERNLSVQELAQRVGIAPETLLAIEGGQRKRKPSSEQLRLFADVLGTGDQPVTLTEEKSGPLRSLWSTVVAIWKGLPSFAKVISELTALVVAVTALVTLAVSAGLIPGDSASEPPPTASAVIAASSTPTLEPLPTATIKAESSLAPVLEIVYSTDSLGFRSGGDLNLETGFENWHCDIVQALVDKFILPCGDALLHDLGSLSGDAFYGLSGEDLLALDYLDFPVVAADPGDAFAVKTNGGNFAKVQVVSVADSASGGQAPDRVLRFTTYRVIDSEGGREPAPTSPEQTGSPSSLVFETVYTIESIEFRSGSSLNLDTGYDNWNCHIVQTAADRFILPCGDALLHDLGPLSADEFYDLSPEILRDLNYNEVPIIAAQPGDSFAVKIDDGHFAKVQVVEVDSSTSIGQAPDRILRITTYQIIES